MRFYFAWVDEASNVFTSGMKREDEFIYDFNFSHEEGNFASLEVTIENPRRGLLSGYQWAWFAYEHETAGTIPLFFGRLVGVPEDEQANYVKLTFIARPSDYEVQKLLLAQSLCVRPYWDPIWFDASKPFDPDNVLESRPQLWHTDPVTHIVTASNIIEGEDGTISLGETNVFYDSIRVSYGQPPVRAVNVTADVSWKQVASGSLDVSAEIFKNQFSIQTYTGEGLISDWPQAGDNIGGDWKVVSGEATAIFYQAQQTTFEPGYTITEQDRTNGLPFEHFQFDALFQPHGGLVMPLWSVRGSLVIGYDTTRDYGEQVQFTLNADVQSVVTDPAGNDIVDINLSSSEVSQPVDPAGAIPLSDMKARSYFATARGAQSLEYLIAVARARLLARARCVDIDLEVPFQDAISWGVSLRKNAVFTDHHMPGGIATGKIKSFKLSLNGDDGKASASITLAATVGNGNSVSAIAGSPDYCEDAYVETAYQRRTGEYVLPDFGDVLYSPIDGLAVNDDGIDFNRLSTTMVVRSCTVTNPAPTFPLHGPVDALHPAGTWSQFYLTPTALLGYPGWDGNHSLAPDYSPQDALKALDDYATKIDLKMAPLNNGPFKTIYSVAVSDLMIPRLVDLEASSS